MSKILAIDYGKKRVGVAITDSLQIIASGLTTVETPKIFAFLQKLFQQEEIIKVLVGEPKQMNGQPSESAEMIDLFVEKFKLTFPAIEVVRVDERFTSKMAQQSMLQGGLKKKQRQNKALVDEIAATILLQDYLLRKKIVG
jgi:putative Holliday junction resolvase